MPEFGEQIDEVPVATLHESVTLDSGETVEVGDVVGHDVRDLNHYRDPDEEPVKTGEVITGTVERIYNSDGEASVSITNDHVGRISADDVETEPDRFDRFQSEVPESDGCIIETWWASFSDDVEVDDEYEIEVNPA